MKEWRFAESVWGCWKSLQILELELRWINALWLVKKSYDMEQPIIVLYFSYVLL